jgi:radical SAM protein with 4Fe4S-binding SPASM domain
MMLHTKLPTTATVAELEKGLFLIESEDKVLDTFLFKSPPALQLQIATTWECNLRCSHCFVAGRLKLKDEGEIDVDALVKFAQEHIKRYNPTSISLGFAGGETLLRANKCEEIIDKIKEKCSIKTNAHVTTNLAFPIDDNMLRILNKFDNVLVSLDGTEEQHNMQRKPLSLKVLDNPFQMTYSNLERLVELGFREKLSVQAAMDETDIEKKCAFYRGLLEIGVKYEKIIYGATSPTERKPEIKENHKRITSSLMTFTPCCIYRYMQFFAVDSDNKLYKTYHNGSAPLGSLNDFNFDEIEKAYKSAILSDMAVLQDSTCRKCDILGLCWGGCVTNCNVYGKNPSSTCNYHKRKYNAIWYVENKGEKYDTCTLDIMS